MSNVDKPLLIIGYISLKKKKKKLGVFTTIWATTTKTYPEAADSVAKQQ